MDSGLRDPTPDQPSLEPKESRRSEAHTIQYAVPHSRQALIKLLLADACFRSWAKDTWLMYSKRIFPVQILPLAIKMNGG